MLTTEPSPQVPWPTYPCLSSVCLHCLQAGPSSPERYEHSSSVTHWPKSFRPLFIFPKLQIFFLFYFTIKFIYLFFDGFVINFSCFRPHAQPWMKPFFPGSPSFHAFICVCDPLGLIMATCPSMVQRLFTGAWATVQWLHHHLPQQLLTARNPLGRGGPT